MGLARAASRSILGLQWRTQLVVSSTSRRMISIPATTSLEPDAAPSPSPITDRIHILGMGSIGKFLAYQLATSNPSAPISLLFHRDGLVQDWESADKAISIRTIQQKGRLRNKTEEVSRDKLSGFDAELVSPERCRDVTTPIKNLIVTTKAFAACDAVGLVKHRLEPNSNVLFLQTGMGSTEEVMQTHFPGAAEDPAGHPRIWSGVFTFGVDSPSPFSINHVGKGSLLIGRYGQDRADEEAAIREDEVAPLCQALVASEKLEAYLRSPSIILYEKFRKLLASSIVNPLTVLYDCRVGYVFSTTPRMRVMYSLIAETGEVLRRAMPAIFNVANVRDPYNFFSPDRLEEFVMLSTASAGESTSTMYEAVKAGKRTEIDYLNGWLVKKGKELGVPTPVNEKIVELVKDGVVLAEKDIRKHFDCGKVGWYERLFG